MSLNPSTKTFVASGSRRLASPISQDDGHVTVSIPYYRCADTLRRAVESILQQTHQSLTIVIVNDGDESPWNLLADIDDPRLVCFDLPKNRGPNFAHGVVLYATPDSYLLIQDADDWSEPDRLATLLHHLRTDGTAGAISSLQYHDRKGHQTTIDFTKFHTRTPSSPARRMEGVSHHGLFRTSNLKAVGGYFGDFEPIYDSFLVNLLILTGGLSIINEPLYHYCYRENSLMNASKTGGRSKAYRQATHQLKQMYNRAYRTYKQYSAGHIGHNLFFARIRRICSRAVSPEIETALRVESNRLREQLT